MKKQSIALTFCGFFLALMSTACSTVEGVGRDLQGLGKVIEKTAAKDSGTKLTPMTNTGNAPSVEPSGVVITPIK